MIKLILLNPWISFGILAAIIAALTASHLYAYNSGKERQKDKCEADKVAVITTAVEKVETIAKEDDKIATDNVKTVEVIRWRTRTIRIKDKQYATAKPLPAICVLDDDRMRNINAALSNQEPSSTSESNSNLPTTTNIAK